MRNAYSEVAFLAGLLPEFAYLVICRIQYTYMIDTAQYSNQIVPILKRYSVPKAAFFGSIVDGKYVSGKSDLDILVQPADGMSLMDFIGLKQDIEDAIGITVDLVSYNGMSKYLKESILSNEKVFYETT